MKVNIDVLIEKEKEKIYKNIPNFFVISITIT